MEAQPTRMAIEQNGPVLKRCAFLERSLTR